MAVKRNPQVNDVDLGRGETQALVDAALGYVRAGWPVFPCNREKSPLTQHGFKDATIDLKQIREWWTKWPNASIATPTGPENGLMVLDEDKPDGSASRKELEAENETLPETLTQKTGGGGFQYLFEYPSREDIPSRNSALAKNIDIKATGGYIILPPSVHECGEWYQWINRIKPRPAPQWLVEICKRRQKSRKDSFISSGGSTLYGHRALEKETGRLLQTPEGERNDTLNNAAYALGQLAAGGELDESEAIDALHRAAQRIGLDEREIPKTIRSGLESGKEEPRTAPREYPRKESESQFEAGSEPLPPPPGFPVEVLPSSYAEAVEQASRAFQTPIEIPAATLLALVGAMVGRARAAEVKPGWTEHPNLYVAIVSRSGVGKSPCMQAFKRSIFRIEKERFVAYQKALAQYQEDVEARKRQNKYERGPAPEKPQYVQLYVEDATEEALTDALSGNPKGILWSVDELASLLSNLSKYRTDGKSDGPKARLMSAYDSGPWKRTRKSGDNAFVQNACLSILGSMQPAILPQLFGNMDAAIGFLPRFLFVRAEPQEPPLWTDEAFQGELRDRIDQLMENLVDFEMDGEEPYYVRMTQEAQKLYKKWFNEQAREPWRDFDAQQYEALSAKLRGQAVRLALILHILDTQASGESDLQPIQADTMQRALRLADWFKAHQRNIWQALSSPQGVMESSPLEKRVAAAIVALKGEIQGGQLPTGRITNKVNEGVSESFRVDARSVGKVVSKLGLHAKKGSGGQRLVAIPEDKMETIKQNAANATHATNSEETGDIGCGVSMQNATNATVSETARGQGGVCGVSLENATNEKAFHSGESGVCGESGDHQEKNGKRRAVV